VAENQAVRDRRDQLRHPVRPTPQVIARQPNRVWVWDITLLPSTVKYQCFYLYLVLDLPKVSLHHRLAHRGEAKW